MQQHNPSTHPEAGGIVDFRYLERKDVGGKINGEPDIRPCLIWNVRAIETLQLVAVLPIVSGATGARVAISPAERVALRLEDTADVVFEEANVFLWPGPHLQPQADRGLIRPRRASRQLLGEIAAGMTGRNCNIVIRP